jgi:hypothetical protein
LEEMYDTGRDFEVESLLRIVEVGFGEELVMLCVSYEKSKQCGYKIRAKYIGYSKREDIEAYACGLQDLAQSGEIANAIIQGIDRGLE